MAGTKQGKGKLVSQVDQYTYEGNFKAGKPELMPNKLLYVRELPEDQKKQQDVRAAEYTKKKKGKKDPKKKGAADKAPPVFIDEEQYPYRVYWNFGDAPLSFDLRAVFQGEAYIDPVKAAQREEEKKAKEAKGGKGKDTKPKKKDAKEEPEMITPDPITVTMESNRKLRFRMSKSLLAESAW